MVSLMLCVFYHKPVHHLQKFPPILLFITIIYVCDKNIKHKIHPVSKLLSIKHSIVNYRPYLGQ